MNSVIVFVTIFLIAKHYIIVGVHCKIQCEVVEVYETDFALKYIESEVSGQDTSKYKPDERMALCFFFLANKLLQHLKHTPEENMLTYTTDTVVYEIHKEKNSKPKFVRGFRCMATKVPYILEVSGEVVTGYIRKNEGVPYLPPLPPFPLFLPPTKEVSMEPKNEGIPYFPYFSPFLPLPNGVSTEKKEEKKEKKKEEKREEKREEKKEEKKGEKKKEKKEEKKEGKEEEKREEKPEILTWKKRPRRSKLFNKITSCLS